MTDKKSKRTILGFDTVEVLGYNFKVIETNNTDELIVSNHLCMGLSMPIDGKIIISTNQSTEQMLQTFYHELLHIIDWILHNESFEYEETTINTLATGLQTVRLKNSDK